MVRTAEKVSSSANGAKIVGHSPKAQIELVTPQIAEQWLGKNTHNRNLNERQIERLARAMKAGEWFFTGDPVQFAPDGTLLNGQHRLNALIVSGTPIELLVVRGVDKGAQEAMDMGARRSLAAVLKLRGEVDTASLASLLNSVYKYDHRWHSMAHPTAQEALALLAREPAIREAIPHGRRVNRQMHGTPPAMAGACYHVFSRLDEADAYVFTEQWATGENLKEGDPVFALRRYCLNQGYQTANSRGYSGRNMMAIVVKAWNAWRKGEPVKLLIYKPGGRNPEPFPVAE
jgi:hypothetical protein